MSKKFYPRKYQVEFVDIDGVWQDEEAYATVNFAAHAVRRLEQNGYKARIRDLEKGHILKKKGS